MMQPKKMVAAFAFAALVTAGSNAHADSRFYVEVGASYADSEDITAEFTEGNENATWGLSDLHGVKLQLGGDFGYFRTDLKLRAYHGDVDSVSGATAISDSSKAFFGTATVNGYLENEFKMGVGDASITPYVGLGGGVAAGFMEADGTIGGVIRNDHRMEEGMAIVGTVGALFSVNEHVGLSAEYERIDTEVGGFDVNTYSLGLRVTF